MNDDIIAAIATSRLEAAISIIRLSGKDVIAFVQSFFSGRIIDKKTQTLTYGYIMDGDEKVDECLVSIYRGKHTFTGEEMVEINCHGGVFITRKVFNLCIRKGARLAQRGEFSKRAFLNGRIDLSQAEAISDMVTANNDEAAKLALRGIQGNISHFIKDLKEDLIQIITQIEVNIDYPEYDDVEELTAEKLLPRSVSLREKMDDIIQRSRHVSLMKDGISTVIVGKPNVGKSSLLNALLDEEKAIVTDIAGTTRDIVEGTIRLDSVVLNMIDTAGIHETKETIEKMGVEKSLSLIDKADLVLVVVDGSSPLDEEDQRILEKTKDTNRIIIINKADLGCVVDLEGIQISAKEMKIDALTNYIKDSFDFSSMNGQDAQVVANERQLSLLMKASKSLDAAISAMRLSVPVDLIVEDLYDSWNALKEILGEQAKEDLLDELFSRFCVGK
ncbi:tRNA uridine-5-carboxymethylaminomethyl(34) synthesis GTPase MnmE [Intestinibaculum porci]|jgi:tRNA modification GTPase|uniref:tRNA modification GTPase MnmE n=1 Tax=Intestinibaculum porci TaxID=2487118 RepID=A0A3G9JPU5_9FIRM|nr:tRNA uridine-5-carboxymethylaminomethyl(34) synthesis GTPase MnmE [Intestinibaculum porci]MDD6349103.1 tRNA uridine-5-carboxymethylaminomethyl(34) synthesis GTPase MnmE [Intestinibaculum porci]MDD6421545.1 tRNA uridine-5-carboxymethylaminomethyl(34) synthesis GTPase MnmE [Intestinibaculum porci]BBH28061.1 tRNA modification GTPase MnmE [Intestinibaculum porci]